MITNFENHTIARVSFRIFIGGRGGANTTIAKLEGGKDFSNAFSLARNTTCIELIDFHKLAGFGDTLPQVNF